MKTDDEILESLITGGLIGTLLGSILSNNKQNGAMLGALAGAAILATYTASEKAKLTKVPFFVEENGNLLRVETDGKKTFIRKIKKPSIRLQQNFKLK